MIKTYQELVALCQRAQEKDCIALDTEFVWNRTYYPKLGVIQIGLAADDCHLIDVPAIDDLTPLGALIADPAIVKILHDAQQDLAILKRVTNAYPRNIFDTRCAAGLAGMGATSSLAVLLENLLGVTLDKSETRTDWLQRPLSEEQATYAIEDVSYLHAAREELLQRIAGMERQSWLEEELATYDTTALYDERDPREQYLRVKGAGRISAREQAILRELTAWREGEARRRDRPRGHVLSDEVMVLLTQRKPSSQTELNGLRGVNRRDVDPVLEQVRIGLDVPDKDCPQRPRRRRRLDGDLFEETLDKAMDFLRNRSGEHSIDAPFVASRAEVRGLVNDGKNSAPENFRLLRGWRHALVGADLLQLVDEAPSNEVSPQ
jgi:ribonuclease D